MGDFNYTSYTMKHTGYRDYKDKPPTKVERIPISGEQWTSLTGTELLADIKYADDQTVVYDYWFPGDEGRNRTAATTNSFVKNYQPPKPKLPATEVFMNVYHELGAFPVGPTHDTLAKAIRAADRDYAGTLRLWIDAEGEPHVERVR